MSLEPGRICDPAASKGVGRGAVEVARNDNGIAPLVRACQQGDAQAQRELYEHCQPWVFRLVARMVGVQAAPDVVQTAFLKLFRTLGQFGGRSQFETWFYRLTVNECLQFLRRERRQPREQLAYEPEDRSAEKPDALQHRELLERALAQLDPELRSIFLLREMEGLSYKELAEALGIADGTVASRLHRARTELQEMLRELGWEL